MWSLLTVSPLGFTCWNVWSEIEPKSITTGASYFIKTPPHQSNDNEAKATIPRPGSVSTPFGDGLFIRCPGYRLDADPVALYTAPRITKLRFDELPLCQPRAVRRRRARPRAPDAG